MKRTAFFLSTLVVVCLALPASAQANWQIIAPQSQQVAATVTGVAEDQTGAAIPKAKLTLTSKLTGEARAATADSAGSFRFENVAPGDYTLKGKADGFDSSEIALSVGTQSPPVAIKIRLKAAAKSEEVTVSGSSKEEELNVSMERNADRLNFDDDLLRGLPAAGQHPLAIIGSFVSPAAQGGEGLNIVVDGVEVSGLNLPAGALRRIRINRNPYSAEFRRPGKSRVEVYTEEGSFRRYRGRVSLYSRNSVFDARNAFALNRPDLNRHLLEANLAGPLFSKNASFFVSGERLFNDESAIINARTLAGVVNANVLTPTRRTNLLGRLEIRAGKAHTLMAIYNFVDETERNRGIGGLRLPEQGYATAERQHRFQFSDRMILSPRLLNDLRFVIERETRQAGRLAATPTIIVQGAFTGGAAQTFRSNAETVFRIQDIASYTANRQTLKFGVEARPVWLEATQASNFGGVYEFAGLNDFAAGRPFVYRINKGQPRVSFTQHEVFGFIQDEIRLRPNLSLTPGLRYGWQSNLEDRNNFAPRLAFAYSPSEKWVIRGGGGIFYERVSEEIRQRSLLYDGMRVLEFVIVNPSFPVPPATTAATPPSVTRAAANLRSPYVAQTGVSIERELTRGNSLALEYQLLRGVRLLRLRNLNAPLNGKRPNVDLFNLNQVESSARSRSHSVSLTWRGSIARRFKGMAQYTFSRSYDDTDGAFALPADNFNLQPEWGRADFDQRHRFNLAGTLELPRNWRMGTFVTLASGVPFNVTTGRDDNGDSLANDRPLGLARNTGHATGLAQVDLRVTKLFRVPRLVDRRKDATSNNLEISLDVFNLFNRMNFDNFIGVQSSPFFGRANAARQARTIQLSTRYKF
ncbi:MAG: TonB-dependent receptor [Blastocatellales bacterium]